MKNTLTDDEKKLFEKWVLERSPKLKCPCCGKSNFTVGEHLVSPPTVGRDGVQLGGVAYPNAMLICTNCAHTLFFNAVVIGLDATRPKGWVSVDGSKEPSNG